jgi:two-component system, NtrC family, response regulator HydG
VELNPHWFRIINTMNEGLMIVGTDGKILMVNQAFEALTGFSESEVVGKPCTLLQCDACERILKPQEDDGWCSLFMDSNDAMKRRRCGILRKDGTCLLALKNASVLTDEGGNVIGAVETITDLSELDRLDQEVVHLSRKLGEDFGFHGLIGESPAMKKVFDLLQRAAASEAPTIIYGESGTGKELVARAVHELGSRKNGPFLELNCAALNESLLESELFGHTKGSFTGAYRHKVGRFEAADGGDLFLDEIGDIPLSVQVKLLRVLESKQFERVGDHRPIRVDVRFITATNQDLSALIEEKKFRDDLFFRINVIPIHLPPLRRRREDIPLLVHEFIQHLRARTSKNITGVSQRVLGRFMEYSWPGNVRELKSTLEYAFVVAESGLITEDHLPPQVLQQIERTALENRQPAAGPKRDLKTELIEALERSGGNQTRAAQALGVKRITVWRRMKKYGLSSKPQYGRENDASRA